MQKNQNPKAKKAQGAIEYLLIIGAAILVTSIVLVAMTGGLGTGEVANKGAQGDVNNKLNELRGNLPTAGPVNISAVSGPTVLTLAATPTNPAFLTFFANAGLYTLVILNDAPYRKYSISNYWWPPSASGLSIRASDVIVIVPPASFNFSEQVSAFQSSDSTAPTITISGTCTSQQSHTGGGQTAGQESTNLVNKKASFAGGDYTLTVSVSASDTGSKVDVCNITNSNNNSTYAVANYYWGLSNPFVLQSSSAVHFEKLKDATAKSKASFAADSVTVTVTCKDLFGNSATKSSAFTCT